MTDLKQQPSQQAAYRSFLLRVWRNESAVGNQSEQQYTFVLQEVSSGQRIGFRSQAALAAFLESQSHVQIQPFD